MLRLSVVCHLRSGLASDMSSAPVIPSYIVRYLYMLRIWLSAKFELPVVPMLAFRAKLSKILRFMNFSFITFHRTPTAQNDDTRCLLAKFDEPSTR